jgi:hypothetical protein
MADGGMQEFVFDRQDYAVAQYATARAQALVRGARYFAVARIGAYGELRRANIFLKKCVCVHNAEVQFLRHWGRVVMP